ncbi:hypothetical protein GOEFS_001_00160 [Gordonia effusa NBRC 100432]|uniref:Uncharacterized protein n=1 Tax=Gordonia effusa NBRC 100432 TaxID=1077974 RepID=H0QUH0_9ACTN|nr:hypothetical protein GOEFS_001_00160 [Gordonia effusa NBRC 100432]
MFSEGGAMPEMMPHAPDTQTSDRTQPATWASSGEDTPLRARRRKVQAGREWGARACRWDMLR